MKLNPNLAVLLIWHLLLLAKGLRSIEVFAKFSCSSETSSSNLLNNSYPRCATNIENFADGIHLRERPWTSGNESELLPPWINIPLAIKGQQFAIDRVAGIVQSHLYGITMILSNPQLRDTLLFTGNSNTVQKSGKRYAATVVQIALWIRRAIQPASAGDSNSNWVLTSIANVRRIHNHVAYRIDKELEHGNFSSRLKTTYAKAPINAQLWRDFEADLNASGLRPSYPSPKMGGNMSNIHPMNQLTFATTHWGFLGLILMNPEAVNVFYPTEEGLEAFAHLWAVIGYGMGIRDEFNLGIANNSQELQKLSREFFKFHIAPHLFNLSHESKFLIEVFIKSASRIVFGLDPEFLLRGILRLVGIQNPRHMNARRGYYGHFADFVSGSVGPGWTHAIFPSFDKILSPIASLYHFFVGFAFFGLKYRSDEDIARFCYYYDYAV